MEAGAQGGRVDAGAGAEQGERLERRLAGAALGVFSAGLLAMYFRNPDMTESDGIRPSQEGMSLAKDAFMAAIAGALVVDNS